MFITSKEKDNSDCNFRMNNSAKTEKKKKKRNKHEKQERKSGYWILISRPIECTPHIVGR